MSATGDRYLAAARALESALGDPREDERTGSFHKSVLTDREHRFPQELCTTAMTWGIAEHLVPEDSGGRLSSIEECFALSRVLSRRDLTAAVAIGANLLASLPVWLHGTPTQKDTVADLLGGGAFLSFALSERDHGADVSAGEVTARKAANGWRIDGTKWPINNSGHASAASVTARTGEGFRGLTLFLLPRDRPPAAGAGGRPWSALPKVRTHGLRGSALGGLAFSDYPAQDQDVVGRVGQGLEILLTTLQVTRILVGSFALGALDTCLRATVDFSRSRSLYGSPAMAMEPVKRKLLGAYADLLIGETIAHAACRAAHLAPSQLALMSTCVKFLVPQRATESIEALSMVLGARSYVAGEHWHGIVEKMRRDCAVTPLFDGSSPVMLGAIVDQLSTLAKAREEGSVEDIPSAVFSRTCPRLPWIDKERLDLATDSDAVLHGITAAYQAVSDEHGADVAPHQRRLLDLLGFYRAETARVDTEIARNDDDPDWRRSGAAYDLAARYTRLHAAGACAWKWLSWRAEASDRFITDGTWLVMCLRRLAGREPAALDVVDQAALARLDHAYDRRYLFSDIEFPLS